MLFSGVFRSRKRDSVFISALILEKWNRGRALFLCHVPVFILLSLGACSFGDSQKSAQAPPPSVASRTGKIAGAGQSLPTAMEALKALSPPQGLNQTQLFHEPLKDDEKRFARLETAVQGLRDEIDIATPTLVRLAAVEKDMKDLIRQLNTLVEDQSKTPEQITAEQEVMPPLPLTISGKKTPVTETSSQGKPAGQPTTQSEESMPPAVAPKQLPAKTSLLPSEDNGDFGDFAPIKETPSQGKPVGQPTTQSEESMPPAVAQKQPPAKASPISAEDSESLDQVPVKKASSQGKPVGQPTTQSEESSPPAVAVKQPPAKTPFNSTPSEAAESPVALSGSLPADSATEAQDQPAVGGESGANISVKDPLPSPQMRAQHPAVAPPGQGTTAVPSSLSGEKAGTLALQPAAKPMAPSSAKAKATPPKPTAFSVSDLRIGDHSDKTRLVLDISGKPDYTARIEGGKLIIELPGAAWGNGAKSWSSDTAALIYAYQVEDLGGVKGGVRIVAELLYDAALDSKSVIPALSGGGNRLVIDVKSPVVHK